MNADQNSPAYRGSPFIETPIIEVALFCSQSIIIIMIFITGTQMLFVCSSDFYNVVKIFENLLPFPVSRYLNNCDTKRMGFSPPL